MCVCVRLELWKNFRHIGAAFMKKKMGGCYIIITMSGSLRLVRVRLCEYKNEKKGKRQENRTLIASNTASMYRV